MDEFHKTASEITTHCREAINERIYHGNAPHDSNALSETWPTEDGAAFTGEHQGHKYIVIVLPQDRYPRPGSPGYPDYRALDAG